MPYTPIQPKPAEPSFWEQLGADLTKTLLNTGAGALAAGTVGMLFPAAAPLAAPLMMGMPLAQGLGNTAANSLGVNSAQQAQQPGSNWYQSRMQSFTGGR